MLTANSVWCNSYSGVRPEDQTYGRHEHQTKVNTVYEIKMELCTCRVIPNICPVSLILILLFQVYSCNKAYKHEKSDWI